MAKEQGKVGVPAEYFLKMAKHDYNDFREALAREFLQNSIDAGARKITVTTEEESRLIVVSDDGCGMDKATLLDKLLVLGGSKKGAGAVGAFGKAKELLFFAWTHYSIRTWRDGEGWFVRGVGGDYEIEEDRPPNAGSGTIVVIEVPKDLRFSELIDAFRRVSQRMQVKAKIELNDTVMPIGLYRGTLKRELSFAKMYQTKCRDRLSLAVRMDGIWMFDTYVGDGYGELVLELSRGSLECLISSRDRLKGQWHDEMARLVQELMVDKKSALRDKPKTIRELIEGDGPVQVENDELEQCLTDGNLQALAAKLHDGGIEAVEQRLRSWQIMVDLGSLQDAEEIKKRLDFIGYRPDFVVDYPTGREGTIRRYMTTAKARTIAKVWTETVKQVFLDIGRFEEFRAGFTFDGEEEAKLSKTDDGVWVVMLNPTNLGMVLKIAEKLLSNRRLLGGELLERAVHEVAHLFEAYHDEDFVSTMSKIRIQTLPSQDEYAKICRIVG